MKLPTPRTVTGWFVSLVLIIILFCLYYGFAFNILSSFYYTNEYKALDNNALDNNSLEKIQVDILVPQNLSRFETREFLVSVKSTSEITESVLIRIDETQDLVLFCSDASSRITDCTGDNILNFGKFAENQKKTRKVWVIIAPRTDTSTPAPVPSGAENEIVKKVSYAVFYKYITESPATPPAPTPTPAKEPSTWQKLNFGAGSEDPLQSTLDSPRAFSMSILFTILLPPWANGILPAIALFIAYSWEHKIQPGQRLKQRWEQQFHLKNTKSSSCIFQFVAILCLLLPFIFFPSVFLLRNGVTTYQVILSFIPWLVLYLFFESADLQDGDPLYREKPKEPGVQRITLSSAERNSLVQIARAAKEEGTEMAARVGDLHQGILQIDERLQNCCRSDDMSQSLKEISVALSSKPNINKPVGISHKRQSSRVSGAGLPVRRMINILQKVEDSLQQTNAILMKQNESSKDNASLSSLDILAFLKPDAILRNENLAEYLVTRLKMASRKRVDELLALNPLTLFNLMALMLVQKNPRIPLSDSDLLEALKDHPDWRTASQFHRLKQLFPYLLSADFYAAENLLGIRLPSLNADIFNPQTPETALVILTEYLKMKSRRQEQTSLPVAVFDYLESIPDEKIGKIKKRFKTNDFRKTLFERVLEGIRIPPARFQAYRFLMKVGCYLPDDLLEKIKTEAKSDDLASLSSELRPFIERCQDETSDVKALREYLCTKNK